MSKFLIPFVALLWSLPAVAEDQALARLFLQQELNGTIVISSLRDGNIFIHNDLRSNERFPIASTFKIMNTLIAVEKRAVSGKDDLLKWNGEIYNFPDWNHDQTLESAFKVSCVWCFQELARRVGADKYRNYLRELEFGELNEPIAETTFWLDGSLQISAVEQVNFLKKVYLRTLPFSMHAYETLRQIMLVEQTPSYSMWAKTGWATIAKPQVGWYVGYIETPGDVWFFAMNIEVGDKKDLPLRQQLTRDALQAKGIIK